MELGGSEHMLNNVTLIGNLATDVTLRELETLDRDGNPMKTASFKLAVNRPGKDKGADFIWCKAWNGTARAAAEYIHKGSKVAVDGSIRTNRVERDGSFVEYVEVSARTVQFLDPRPTQAGQPADVAPEGATTDTPEPVSDDDIPF